MEKPKRYEIYLIIIALALIAGLILYVSITSKPLTPPVKTNNGTTGATTTTEIISTTGGTTTTGELDLLYGDVNDDKEVDARDVLRLRQYLADWDVYANLAVADCNDDGEIDARDVLRLRQFLADWPVTIGPVKK